MFLRKQGRRFLLLHSYRDGRGKVGQRRLWCFENARQLERADWSAIRAELSQSCPEIKVDWFGLRSRARQQLAAASTAEEKHDRDARIRKLRQACRAVRRLLADEEDSEVLRLAEKELAELAEAAQDARPHEATVEELLEENALEEARELAFHQLPLGRRAFDRSERVAQPYLKCLELAGDLQERVQRCPTSEAREAYGRQLMLAGRPEEAIEQFGRSRGKGKLFNEGAALLAAGRIREAWPVLLRGMARNPEVQRGLKYRESCWYWESWGEIWSEESKRFVRIAAADPTVRGMLARARGRKARSVMRKWLENLVLERILAKHNEEPCASRKVKLWRKASQRRPRTPVHPRSRGKPGS